jgi:hypothetical protein
MRKWTRPSLGFSIVVATYALTVAFFAWGLSTPPLDRVWQLHHELKIGRLFKLSKEDRQLLTSAMQRHPSLAAAMLDSGQAGIISAHRDGWIDTPYVTLIRTPRSPASLRLLFDVQTPLPYIPYDIEIDGAGWERKVAVEARGKLVVELPAPPPEPELIIVKIKGDELRADPASIGVRLSFDPPQDALEPGEGDDEDDE